MCVTDCILGQEGVAPVRPSQHPDGVAQTHGLVCANAQNRATEL